MRVFLTALTLAFCLSSAQAADVGAPVIPVKAKVVAPTPTYWSGFYVGGNLIGLGASLTDISAGIPASAFSSGGGLGIDIGGQFWTQQFFLGAEAFCDVTALSLGTGNGFSNTYMCGQVAKAGMGLDGLLGGAGVGVTAPSQSPVPLTVPAGLSTSLMAPYMAAGIVERPWGVGWAAGAGINYVLSAHWNLDMMYLNVNYNNANINPNVSERAENLVKLSARYHF